MKLDLQNTINGHTLRVIRDFFRKHEQFEAADIVRSLGVSSDGAERLVAELCDTGLVRRVDADASGASEFELTDLGIRLRNKKATKPISRAAADAAIRQLRARIAEINADENLVYLVDEVRVFGSYLDGKDQLGDVDVAVRLKPRPQFKSDLARTSLARARAKNFSGSHVERVFFGQIEVHRLLKSASRHLSVHEMDDLEAIGARSEVLFTRWPCR